MTIWELNRVKEYGKLVRNAAVLGEGNASYGRYKKAEEKARQLIEELEDLTCLHNFQPLLKTSTLHECSKCKSRRVIKSATEPGR